MRDVYWWEVRIPVALPSPVVADAERVAVGVTGVIAAGAAMRAGMPVLVGAPSVSAPVSLPPERVRLNAELRTPGDVGQLDALVSALVGPHAEAYMVDAGFHAWVQVMARTLVGASARAAAGGAAGPPPVPGVYDVGPDPRALYDAKSVGGGTMSPSSDLEDANTDSAPINTDR